MHKAANTGKASPEQMVLAWLLLRKEFGFLSLRARYARAACMQRGTALLLHGPVAFLVLL